MFSKLWRTKSDGLTTKISYSQSLVFGLRVIDVHGWEVLTKNQPSIQCFLDSLCGDCSCYIVSHLIIRILSMVIDHQLFPCLWSFSLQWTIFSGTKERIHTKIHKRLAVKSTLVYPLKKLNARKLIRVIRRRLWINGYPYTAAFVSDKTLLGVPNSSPGGQLALLDDAFAWCNGDTIQERSSQTMIDWICKMLTR